MRLFNEVGERRMAGEEVLAYNTACNVWQYGTVLAFFAAVWTYISE